MHEFADRTSREWLPAALRRLIFQAVWGWALVAVGLGAGEPVPKRALVARQAAPQRDVIRLRDPTDALELQFNRSHLIFNPQEVLHARVSLDSVESRQSSSKPVKALLKWKLLPAGQSRSLASGTVPVVMPSGENGPADVPLEFPLPREEGVYDLRLSAGTRRSAEAELAVQLVVFDPKRPSGVAEAVHAEKLVDSFVPATSGMFRKVSIERPRAKVDPSWSRFLKFPRRHDDAANAQPETGDSNATAYRLKVSHPGRPHRLEVALSGSNVYQQIFWPNAREPTVLIDARPADHPSDVSRIELYEMGEHLPAARATAFDHTSLEWKQRLVGLHLSSSGLTRNFGAVSSGTGPAPDTGEKRLVDDWQTVWTAAQRLTEYLRYQQHNALLLAVSNANDGPEKDLVELVLRLFDREDLVLVGELSFDAPLPALERLLLAESDTTQSDRQSPPPDRPDAIGDLLLVNAAGQTKVAVDEVPDTGDKLNSGESSNRRKSSPESARRASYNILSPRVQEAVLEVTREFVERYSSHSSFGGVAFELGTDSYLQLPGIEWGYDPETVRLFEHATRLHVPRTSRPEAQQQATYRYLTTTARREWIRYRCGEVARFHRKLAELVLAAKPDAQVFFSGRLWTEGAADTEGAVLDFVRKGGGPAQLLHSQGLDFSQAPYATDARVTVLRPLMQLSSDERLPQAAAATFNHSPAIDALYRLASPGGLLYSPAAETHIAQIEVDAGPGGLSGMLRPTDAPAVVEHYAHLLATLDAQAIFDGSGAFPQAPADSTRRMRAAIAAMPSLLFRPAGPQPQPLVVRTAQHGNITWLYAANDSSLPLAIDLYLDCPAGTACRMLDGSRAPGLVPISGNHDVGNPNSGSPLSSNRARLHIDLRGNDLWACRFERAGVVVVDTHLVLSGETLAGVEHRIDRLTAKMHAVASLARAGSRQLSNPGFEQQADRTKELPGWEMPVEQAGWSLDEDNPRSGHRSLAISAEANKTALASPVLELEGNRFVTLSLWLRSNKPSARVRIVFEATIDGEPFRHEEPVEAGKSWRQHVFRVDPLPTGPMQKARLSVRAVDSCKLWVDDVEIGAQSYSSDEVRQLTKTLSSVKLAWEAARYADCQRLLDGYWGQLLLAEPAATSPVSDKPRLGDRLRNKFRR